jgi:hypothetical protein
MQRPKLQQGHLNAYGPENWDSKNGVTCSTLALRPIATEMKCTMPVIKDYSTSLQLLIESITTVYGVGEVSDVVPVVE